MSPAPPLPTAARQYSAFPAIVLTIALLYMGLFAYFIALTAGRMSGYDFLDWIMQYGDGPKNWFGYLWAPHNEHRIAADRLLVAIDVGLLGGTTLPFVIVRTLLLAIMIAGLARQIWLSAYPAPLKAIAISLLVFALLPANVVVMCSMPVMGGFIHTATFAVFALLLWDSGNAVKRVLSLVAAVVAGFGVAGGLFIWPVLAFAAWRGGSRPAQLAVVIGGGVAMWAAYLTGLPSHAGLLSLDLQRAVAIADFVVRFLGLPWSHSAALVWPGRIIGAAVLATGGYLILTDAFSRQIKPPVERIGLGMVQFAFLLALAAALSRWDTAPDREMPVRYGAMVALAHAGLLLASLRWLAGMLAGRQATLMKTAIVAAALALLAQQALVGRAAVREAGLYSDAWTRFSAGEWTPDMSHYVYPDRVRAEQILQHLKSRHLYGQ